MGPLVDVVATAVPPVLEELRGRPGVIDLVEVHLVRLGETEHPEPSRRDEHDDDPQVEPVEASAGLAVERLRSVGADRARHDLQARTTPRRRPR